jgi:serine/threonine protein kinase
MTFLPLVIQELDPNLLQLKKEEGIVTAAASTSVNASASATATTQLEWIGRFCTVDNNKEDEEETSFDYLFFLEFVFYPMCTNLYQVEIKKTLGPMDIYTNVFEAQLVYHQQSPKNQKTTRHVLVKQLTLDHTNMNHTKSNSYSSNIHTILHLIRHRINILRLFQHPHLLKFYSTLQQQNYKDLYLIQEYQEHCTLKTTLKAFGPMKETTIRRYLLQILDALEFLHTKGLFHG